MNDKVIIQLYKAAFAAFLRQQIDLNVADIEQRRKVAIAKSVYMQYRNLMIAKGLNIADADLNVYLNLNNTF